jgi:transcriptional regulator with XRE-family HTH domain
MEMGKIIKFSRLKNEISQKELSEKIGVDVSAVSLWEAGKRIPSGDILIRIANVLEIVPDLFPGYVKADQQSPSAQASGNDPPPEPKEDREDREDRFAKLEREISELRKELDSMQEIRSIVESLQRKS